MWKTLLQETEILICQQDPFLWELCSLPGARVEGVDGKVPTPVEPSDYCPLLISQVGSDRVAASRPRAILGLIIQGHGTPVKGSGAQAVFFSVLPVTGNEDARRQVSQQINTLL